MKWHVYDFWEELSPKDMKKFKRNFKEIFMKFRDTQL